MRARGLFVVLFWLAAGCRTSSERTGAGPPRGAAPAVEALPSALAHAAVAAAASPSASAAPAAAAPGAARVDNVVLVTIDSLRADQPWVGYPHVQTPHLSALAARSTVYTRAYSISNMTTSSLSGLLAGRYPSELRRDTCALAGYAGDAQGLAPVLKAGGVRTLAALGHTVFVARLVPADGFDEWRMSENASARASDGAVTGEPIAALAVRTLQEFGDKGRFFAWTHFVDPHDKYVRHPEFPVGSSGMRADYDTEVAYTDRAVGKVLDAVAASPYADRTAIVVTADHGEMLGEHGSQRHGFSTYEEEMRVPLIVYVPGRAPARVEVARGAIDLAPTIAELLGVPAPEVWRGRSLLPDAATPAPDERPIFVDIPELDQRPGAQIFIQGKQKAVFSGIGGARFVDLERDPTERESLAGRAAIGPLEAARLWAKPPPSLPPKRCTRKLGRARGRGAPGQSGAPRPKRRPGPKRRPEAKAAPRGQSGAPRPKRRPEAKEAFRGRSGAGGGEPGANRGRMSVACPSRARPFRTMSRAASPRRSRPSGSPASRAWSPRRHWRASAGAPRPPAATSSARARAASPGPATRSGRVASAPPRAPAWCEAATASAPSRCAASARRASGARARAPSCAIAARSTTARRRAARGSTSRSIGRAFRAITCGSGRRTRPTST